ncbi:MAG: hypothetical protein FWF37_04320 [Chloroflexi bacterium]|nr:hypothetical protein [Chloroflexota bacterium]
MKKITSILLCTMLLLICVGCSNNQSKNVVNIEDYKNVIIEQIAAPLGVWKDDVQIVKIEKSSNDNTWIVTYNLINCSFLSENGKPVFNCTAIVKYTKEYDTVFLQWIRYGQNPPTL